MVKQSKDSKRDKGATNRRSYVFDATEERKNVQRRVLIVDENVT